MTRTCNSCLVIGVDEFTCPVLPALPGARMDALEMARLLSAGNSQVGTLLIDASTNLGRIQILKRVAKWMDTISPEGAGILYVATHGVVDDGELVLCGHDYDLDAPFDSGIPVRRLWEIAGRRLRPGALCVFVLDVCHSGLAEYQAHNPSPGSVCVTTAKKGDHVYEVNGRGAFAGAIVEAAGEQGRLERQKQLKVSLRDLLKLTEGILAGSTFKQELRVSGASHQDVSLWVNVEHVPKRTLRKSVLYLRTRPITEQRSLIDRLEDYLGNLVGLPGANMAFVEVYQKDQLSVRLPVNGSLFRTDTCLRGVVSAFYGLFSALELECDPGWNKAEIRALSRSLRANSVPCTDVAGATCLSWRGDSCSGLIELRDQGGVGVARVGVSSFETSTPTLELLGRSLEDVVLALTSATAN